MAFSNRRKEKEMEKLGEIITWSILVGGAVFLFISILRQLAAL